MMKIATTFTVRPRPSGLGEIDGLHGTSTQSCILTYDLCTGEPLRRPKPAQDEWYVIMSGHPFIKALAAYWGGASVQGLRCHFISMRGKSPMKLEVTSRYDHSCLLGCKASKQTNKQIYRSLSLPTRLVLFLVNAHMYVLLFSFFFLQNATIVPEAPSGISNGRATASDFQGLI